MDLVDKLAIKLPEGFLFVLFSSFELFGDLRERLVCYGSSPIKVVEVTGYIERCNFSTKLWFINGIRTSFEEVFEKLSDEEKEEVIWNMDEWK